MYFNKHAMCFQENKNTLNDYLKVIIFICHCHCHSAIKKEYRLYFQNEKTESIIHFKMSLFKFGFTSTALF